jgi:hypothetical protein
MSQQLSSAATQAAIAALRDELMFQKVLLESLKDSNSNVDDKAAESSIKNEIQVLERRMKDMVKPNTSALTPPSPPFTFTSSASANNKIKHSPASSKMDYPLRRGPPGFQCKFSPSLIMRPPYFNFCSTTIYPSDFIQLSQ